MHPTRPRDSIGSGDPVTVLPGEEAWRGTGTIYERCEVHIPGQKTRTGWILGPGALQGSARVGFTGERDARTIRAQFVRILVTS